VIDKHCFPKLNPQTFRKCASMGSEEVFFEKIRNLRQLCRDMFYLSYELWNVNSIPKWCWNIATELLLQ
jgi:hypothetical protein